MRLPVVLAESFHELVDYFLGNRSGGWFESGVARFVAWAWFKFEEGCVEDERFGPGFGVGGWGSGWFGGGWSGDIVRGEEIGGLKASLEVACEGFTRNVGSTLLGIRPRLCGNPHLPIPTNDRGPRPVSVSRRQLDG